jgi:myo-inositol-1(or 4)-monophosphatase
MRPELEAAVAAVRAAQGRLAGRAGQEQVISKGGRDVVTAADIAAEDAIRDLLLQRFPDYPGVGEERGGRPAAAGKPYWLVDPLCGTRPFASGLPTYCTNIALVEDGEVTAAAIGDGTSADVYLAERGQGAWILDVADLRSIRVGDSSPILWVDPADKTMGPWTAHAAEFLRLALLRDRWYLWLLGTTLSFAWLAKGSVVGVIYFHMNAPLHCAAGCLVAGEAGAVVTDIAGAPWSLQSRTFLAASSPALHEDLLALIHTARAPGSDLVA